MYVVFPLETWGNKVYVSKSLMESTFERDIVQFLHPGSEYPLQGTEGTMSWNYGPHHRKFMQAMGDYVENGKRINGVTLMFWGEWEPQSHYNLIKSSNGESHYVHKPLLDLNESIRDNKGRIRQNTDPFVFEDAFYYRICQQIRRTGPTQLSFLDIGSIVLFGSHVNGRFVLDTVFVVDDSREYPDVMDSKELNGFVPSLYSEIVGIGLGNEVGDNNGCGRCNANTTNHPVHFRCYRGATFENLVNGMYSFVPCRLSDDTQWFERPVLTPKDVDFISEIQSQGFKLKRGVSLEESRAIWESVREACHKQGFIDGVRFYYDEVKTNVEL